jgi:NAD(P)-dependent dehydrogenase (short-subunit alcohol dehydrogenase family)
VTFAIYPSLAGRNVFVSGGATGIGADIVRAFARNHARVAFVDLQRAEASDGGDGEWRGWSGALSELRRDRRPGVANGDRGSFAQNSASSLS